MQVLYLPKAGLSPAHDLIRTALRRRFQIDETTSYEDAVNILSLQQRNQTYAYEAFVAGEDPAIHCLEIETIRRSAPCIPLITLTSQKPLSAVRTRVLNAGADDCLPVRHVSAEEIEATVLRRILSRHEHGHHVVEVGKVVFNLLNRTATCYGQLCSFAPQEWSILEALVMAYPKIVSSESLNNATRTTGITNVLQTQIARIRQKFRLIDADIEITPRYKMGYALANR